jgi:hypothetical protein
MRSYHLHQGMHTSHGSVPRPRPACGRAIASEKHSWWAVFMWPSFETAAFGVLLRMRAFFRGEVLKPHGEEAPKAPSRTIRPGQFGPEKPSAIAMPQAGEGANCPPRHSLRTSSQAVHALAHLRARVRKRVNCPIRANNKTLSRSCNTPLNLGLRHQVSIATMRSITSRRRVATAGILHGVA